MIVDPPQGEQQSDGYDDGLYVPGCEGPDVVYVKLISSDGHEFIMKRQHALLSRTINDALKGSRLYNEIHFTEVPSHVLGNVCLYFMRISRRMQSRSSEVPEIAS